MHKKSDLKTSILLLTRPRSSAGHPCHPGRSSWSSSSDPAVVALVLQLAYKVVAASDADEGGSFLTDAGMMSLQEAMEAKEVIDNTATVALASGGALGVLVFQSEDLNQARAIVAAVLGEFLGLLSPSDRSADSPHAVQRLLVCLFLGRPLAGATGGSGVGIKAWRQEVADQVMVDLQANTYGDPSPVEWSLVRTQMAGVVDAISGFVPGGRSQHHLRMAAGALLVVHHLIVVLPEALRDVANRPASELKQYSPRRPMFGHTARWHLLDQFEKAASVSSVSTEASSERGVERTVGSRPADGPLAPHLEGQGQADMSACKREPQHRVDGPRAHLLGRQSGSAPLVPLKEHARSGPPLPDGRGELNGERAPQGTYPSSLPNHMNLEEQSDPGLLENIDEEQLSLARDPSGLSDGPGRRVLQQSVVTEILGTVAEAVDESRAVFGHQKDLLGNHARGVVGARSIFDISLLQGGNHMVSPYTVMSLILREGSAKTGEGLNMSLLDSADPSRAGIVSVSARPTGTSMRRAYVFTLIRRLDRAGRAVMSPMSGPSVRNLFPVAFSQVEVTERRLVENCRAACREGLLSQESLDVRVQYFGRIFNTVRDLLQPFMHSVTTSDGVFKWYFQRWAAVSVFIIRCLNRPLLPPLMAGPVAAAAEPATVPLDPFLREGFVEYLGQMMAEEASTIRNFLGHASDHKDKAVGYPIVPALLLSLTTCSICGSAGGITVAYDGKRVDRTMVHCEACAPNPTIAEHEALVEAINEKQPFSAPLVPAAPAFGECRVTMNPLFYSTKAVKPKPVTS